MSTSLSFTRGERLGAEKLNALVRAIDAAGGPAAHHMPGSRQPYHQSTELTPPREPAGGLYDRRRGLAAIAGSALTPAAVDCTTAWMGYDPGVQTATGRVAPACTTARVLASSAAVGDKLVQIVKTNSMGTCVRTCTAVVPHGQPVPSSTLWSPRANEGGQIVRLLGSVVHNPLGAASCTLPLTMRRDVRREHDLQLPVLTASARLTLRGCHTAGAELVDPANQQTALVRTITLHAPEQDLSLHSATDTVTLWSNQLHPAANGGHVYVGPGAVVQQGQADASWYGNMPSAVNLNSYPQGQDMTCYASAQGSRPCDNMTAWQEVVTDKRGLVTCSTLRTTPCHKLPGCEQWWDTATCKPGRLYRRIGHITGGIAATDYDFRLPVLTQNAPVQSDLYQSKGVKLVQEPDATPNRYIKRLLSCVTGLKLCDRGCVIALVSAC